MPSEMILLVAMIAYPFLESTKQFWDRSLNDIVYKNDDDKICISLWIFSIHMTLLCNTEHHFKTTLRLLIMALGWTYAAPKGKVVRPHKDGPPIIDSSDILVLSAAMCLISGM